MQRSRQREVADAHRLGQRSHRDVAHDPHEQRALVAVEFTQAGTVGSGSTGKRPADEGRKVGDGQKRRTSASTRMRDRHGFFRRQHSCRLRACTNCPYTDPYFPGGVDLPAFVG